MDLFVPPDSDWLAVSPDGLFDGTQAGWQDLFFRLASVPVPVYEPEQFFYNFFQPGLLEQIVREKDSMRAILERAGDPRANMDIPSYRDSRPPEVHIVKTTYRNLPLSE